jgi:hypothetical protein
LKYFSFIRRASIWLVVSLLPFLLAGCGLWRPSIAGPAAPCSIVNSKQAADRLLQRIDAATKTRGATITITATSQELTSLLNSFLDEAKSTDPTASIPIENATICFKNGKMSLFGKINTLGVDSTGLISIAAAVSNGRASFRVEQVELGPLSVPSGLGDIVSALISNVLNQNLAKIQLTQVDIRGDQIVLTGKVR